MPIAVVGIGCRLPGARGPEELWDLLTGGIDVTTALPEDRGGDATTALAKDRAGNAQTRGGFLEGLQDPDAFDAGFFGVRREDVPATDPQQRLALTVAWEALEDAGLLPAALSGTRTSVFLGQSHADHWEVLRAAQPGPQASGALARLAGTEQRALLSGRLSYFFGWHGTSLTVDTGQASSLAAVHLACASLRSGEATLALAGGVNAALSPAVTGLFAQAGVLSPDGACRFGDARANGFVRSDGAGIVVLKPLERALADGDRIRAVLRGSALSNDGATKEQVTDPSATGQRLAMRWAHEDAGTSPHDVDYVEAHGTGTRIDAVELAALNDVYGEGRSAGRRLLVGSVKTNIGHCEAAAGVAGLIKAVLCLEHRTVPPSLHIETPSPKVHWERIPLVVPTANEPLPAYGRPAVVAVNGQSISGANAHVILAEAPPAASGAPADDGPWPLHLSAPTARGLATLLGAYVDHLAPDGPGRAHAARDLCWTSWARRTAHAHRLTVHGSTHDQLHRALTAALAGGASTDAAHPADGAGTDPAPLDGACPGASADTDRCFPAGPGTVAPLPRHPWDAGAARPL
ncbi:polyketide synthase [Streptomyces coelicoflavus]|uniref:Polyketide synthase n=1 Tax=Streptomyces coelicoflavus TaxID=285562 RepID=A0A6N9UJL3_9ACTN|nr:polyketide synthase [Streptomyces coelicoflavus]NEB17754.1 polyketide synthase [Streptomyces coelicoflavus]